VLSSRLGYPTRLWCLAMGRKGVSSRRLRLCIVAIAIGSAAVPGLGRSDERPQPPQNPASTADCETFKQQHLAFANSVTQKSIDCGRQYLLQAKNEDYISYKSSCSEATVRVIRQCAEELDAALCAWTNFRKYYTECMRQVRQKRSEDQPKERRETIDPHTIVLSSEAMNGALTSGALTFFRDVKETRAHKGRW